MHSNDQQLWCGACVRAKIPVSHHDGHGIGVKSMIHVMEKYDATYGFTAKNGVFTFGVSM